MHILGIIGFGILGGVFLFLFPFLLIKLMFILLFVSIIFRRGFGRFHARRFYGGYGPMERFSRRRFRGPFYNHPFYQAHDYGFNQTDSVAAQAHQDFMNGKETLRDQYHSSTPLSI